VPIPRLSPKRRRREKVSNSTYTIPCLAQCNLTSEA